MLDNYAPTGIVDDLEPLTRAEPQVGEPSPEHPSSIDIADDDLTSSPCIGKRLPGPGYMDRVQWSHQDVELYLDNPKLIRDD
jgi:hypothetical protein